MSSLIEFLKWVLAISLVTGGVFSVDAALRWLGSTSVELMAPGQQQQIQMQRPAVPLQPQGFPVVPQG